MTGSPCNLAPSERSIRQLARALSTAWQVTECPEHGHAVPGHPPFCNLSALDAEYRSEINLRLAPRRWKWTHRALLRALIRGPRGDQIPLGDQKLDRLDGIRKNCRILLQKFLDLIKAPNLETWSCFAMADNIWRDEVVECIRLTPVPCVDETLDYGLVLLCCCAHGEVPSVIVPAYVWTDAPM